MLLISSNKYADRGVSFDKKDVHDAIKNIDKGLYPKSFCKIIPDIISNDDDYCLVMHADGAGTKSSLAYFRIFPIYKDGIKTLISVIT